MHLPEKGQRKYGLMVLKGQTIIVLTALDLNASCHECQLVPGQHEGHHCCDAV